jgi:hypothetical protein
MGDQTNFSSLKVSVLYLDRPRFGGEGWSLFWEGRFGYSDLKGAALSGALDLWVLNRLGLSLGTRGWWDIGDRVTLNRELGGAEQPQGVEEAWRAEALEAFRVAQAASRVSVAEHVERSRLELMSHAAHK